ncbi:hypothetical protein LR48_Vigan06g022400 [Vigna angularis]|uniref:KIB1-4 beta-propeller domain-containing protein n=2 Tax=Phaseolus angularis TaxID=3914 RepID=A0A0L9UQB1_PHAAN|nr:hypothetical protein LR48_Vigan06g022400 [Vigna angularis]BAU00334.1 hypothetical protein VIGAN_10192000 [Vigna angularis var. angularis]
MLVHRRRRKLAFWVIGANSWIKYKKQTDKPFQDAVFCNGSFYLLDDGLNIWQIDVRSIYSAINNDDGALSDIKTRIYEVQRPGIFQLQHDGIILRNQDTNQTFTYLVESIGKLLIVRRYFNLKQNKWIETKKFEVYAMDFEELAWKKVKDLGDEMIFLGKCCSTSFSAKELGVEIRNSIYLCNDQMDPWANEWDFSHVKRKMTRLGLNRTDVNNWGIFTFGNEDDEPFFFHGDIDMWTDTWFTAPSWWCCRNIPPIKRK